MDPFRANRTAVLVIDVQAGLFSADPPPYEAAKVLERINGVLRKARSGKVPVFLSQQDGSAEEDLAPLTPGWELHRELSVGPGDRIFRKTTCDAFYGTSLESELRTLSVDTLVILGFATEFCVDATVRNAVSKDFEVVVVADGHTTSDSPVLGAELVRKHHNWAWPNCYSPKPLRVINAADIAFTP